MKRWIVWTVLLAWLAGGARLAVALEPWADKRLPEKAAGGLVLWLDAAAQNAARQAEGKPRLVHQSYMEVWFDASGNGRHLVQKDPEALPRFQVLGNGSSVRFDGKDDFLASAFGGRELDRLTVFLVAAPFSNPGGFRAFLAATTGGKNDYTTGLNIDLGPLLSPRWQFLNVEGAGCSGAANLLGRTVSFGRLHRLTVTSEAGPEGVKLYVDGEPAGRRGRDASVLRIDQLLAGARLYSNEARPPHPRGFLDGDIAEVLIFDRVLDEAERRSVDKYLESKYAPVVLVAPDRTGQRTGKPLVTVPDPPPLQMLVPGFTVKQLPVDLPNINNVRYRSDGKLVALGYNGNVYLLSDTNGDGLEDKVELFWDNKGRLQGPIGVALTPPGYPRGAGLFVASKGKVSLIVDTDGDDRADKEIIVAEGWKPIPQNVDAIGVALDREGSVFFGLGTAAFNNAYLMDKEGRSHYDLNSERGTILKVAPDFSKREVVATGVRFPVALAFNRHGDLFATDQEGATWLANGNPFDELLHIQPGRHYGFPPRHPKHLPGVIDEPSVFDYGPQHQSTCGLYFNEAGAGGRAFGPSFWAGDALVCGESRGKLYRTKLVQTPAGYVAQNHLLACLDMLTVDACVAPAGALVVAVHSGPPDWGTGPNGKGKLYKVFFSDPQSPQPLLAWAAGPGEVRIAFDRPLDPARLANVARQVEIDHGKFVRAGDRFEVLRPPYAVVQQQLAAPRHGLPVLSAGVSPDRRVLILTTAPHPEPVHYAVKLPGLGRPAKPAEGELPQHPAIDLDYTLAGVWAEWHPAAGGAAWSGWLPHLDPAVCRELTQGSSEHEALGPLLSRPGRLTLRTKLDLGQMLRPAVQPGSTLDHTWPAEEVTLTFTSRRRLQIKSPAGTPSGGTAKDGRLTWSLRVTPRPGEPVPMEIALDTGEQEPELRVAFSTNEDPRPRALPLARLLLPWAPRQRGPSETVEVRRMPELEGGSWARGREVFFSEQSQCAKCHQVRGQGGLIGPDLSNLVHRDYESVLRDIRFPSAAINPDHLTSQVALRDGRALTGAVRSDGVDRLVIGDITGKETTLSRAQVESMEPSSVSVMPEGLEQALGAEKLRDLLTFLLTEPLTPAPLERPGAPPPRSRAELEAVLKDGKPPAGPQRKLHVVLAAGPKDHGAGEHDYPLWQRRWVKLLDMAEDVAVSEATGWPSAQQLAKADLVLFYSNNPGWTAERAKDLDAFLERGGGLVYIHWAVNGHKAADALAERIGLAWGTIGSRFRHGPLELSFPDAKHPITRGFEKVKFIDESYWNLAGDPKRIHVLATAVEEGAARPLLWTREQGKGRVFVSIPGHYTWTFDDPLFRVLILRGMAWAAGEPVDRFNPLAAVGARLKAD